MQCLRTNELQLTIGSHITNYKTLAHRNVVTAESDSSAPCDHCELCGNFGCHRTPLVNYTEDSETPSKTNLNRNLIVPTTEFMWQLALFAVSNMLGRR